MLRRQDVGERDCGALTFLVTEFGTPYTRAGFGNRFRDRCDDEGVKGRSAHGLWKALQPLGAEKGLTDRELTAIAGHASAKETDRSLRAAQRTTLARARNGQTRRTVRERKCPTTKQVGNKQN